MVKNILVILALALLCPNTNLVGQAKPVDQSDLPGLIKELGDNSYAVRRNASSKISSLGAAAIQPLILAIDSTDHETAFRAARILKEIAVHSDLETLEKVVIQTQELPNAARHGFDRWGLDAIHQWEKNRMEKSVRMMRSLGARLEKNELMSSFGLLLDESSSNLAVIKRSDPKPSDIREKIVALKKVRDGIRVTPKPAPPTSATQEIETADGRMKFRVIGGKISVVEDMSEYSAKQDVLIGAAWKGSAKDLSNLRFVSNLNQVQFVEKNITKEMLQQLEKLPQIKTVLLTRCKYSFDDLRHFKKSWESSNGPLQLVAVGAGYLGVYGPTNGEPDEGDGSFVSMVSPDSAAMAAGVQHGDLILKVDQESITNFADLSMVISSKPVGKDIKLFVQRGKEKIELTAQLKSRAELLR